ncbi:TetR/AcrR family transcriptional regulator [Fontibacillus phaseoli]|uniref:TetR/AcrR family transcriptional regulator n=1 Tax=Fontibacillus phaseoli TaxID=1416533 RepID=UPI000DF48C83|nr:TetR/AcrR family transcriptional regulator [Fontibacillus phaseoli]
MPKQVDHEQRKQNIAEATWRVIVNQGMEEATVRNIAKEANLSLGALRHDFPSQESLLAYAMNLVKERAGLRIAAIAAQDLPPKDKVLGMLLEIVPTDEQTRAEMEVWFVFTAYHNHKRDNFDAHHDGISGLIRHILEQLNRLGLLKQEVQMDLEADKLYALVDGLAMHALFDPQRLDKERVTRVLESYLFSIGRFPE